MFAYYAKRVHQFSEKAHPLSKATELPLNSDCLDAFNVLKEEIAQAVVSSIDESVPFVVETDASDHAIAASRNQIGRPVAFSRAHRQRPKRNSHL